MKPAAGLRRKVAVGVVSRGRPVLLARLLDSFCRLELDASEVELHFIIVENHAEKSPDYAQVIGRFREKLRDAGSGSEVAHDLETNLGIAFARNRVLELAVRERCDFVAYTDDDCLVPPGWIRELLAAQRVEDADIVGGYVLYSAEVERPSALGRIWVKAVNSYWDAYMRKRMRMRKVDHGTGNLLVKLAFVQKHGVRFDVEHGLAPREDVKFCMACKELGAKFVMAPDSTVRECMTADRVSVMHTFHRMRIDEIIRCRMKEKPRFHAVGDVVLHSVLFVSHLGLSAFGRVPSLMAACRRAGYAVASVQYLLGTGSTDYYEETTGH